jgi:hypothetical protein
MWETLFTPSSRVKATELYRFCLNDKRSPNRQSIFSDISKCSRTLSDCSSPSRHHKLSDKILLKSLSLFSDKWSPKGIAYLVIVMKAREYLAIVLRQVASELSNKYYPNHFCFFSDMWSPKGIACLAIACRKIASEVLAIRHSQNHKQLFSEFWSPKCHRLFRDKRAQNCRIYLAIISSRSPVIISDINTPNG